MSRDFSSPMLASLVTNAIAIGFMLDITFRSESQYVWTGYGNLVYGGNTYRGVGSLGKIDTVSEGVEVNAEGTAVTLSGIDAALLSETLGDIQLGAPASLYWALFDSELNILGTPYPLFVGTVDQPSIQPGIKEFSITIKLENKLINLQRPNMRRYTSADQNLYFPDDIAFQWVEQLNDQALLWG
jgi:hypothetical protein